MSTQEKLVSIKEMDYLDEDAEIRGQKYVCLSFISPEDVIQQKEVYFFSRYLESFANQMNEFFENMKAHFKQDNNICELIKGLRQRYDFLFASEQLQEDYNFFKQTNDASLQTEYLEKNNFQTSVRGIKIRGSYETFVEAQRRAESIRKIDNKFDVYVAQVGCWCPWSPHPENIQDVEYANTQLNTLMKKYKENQDNRNEVYQNRKEDMVQSMKNISIDEPIDQAAEIQENDVWSQEKLN